MTDTPDDDVRISAVWVGVDDLPVHAANQVVIQHSAQDEFILTFGHLAPPILLGSPEERLEQAKQLSYLTVKPTARLGFNRKRLVELIDVLRQNLETHDKNFGIEDDQ